MKTGFPKPLAPLTLTKRARKALEKLAENGGPIDIDAVADAILFGERGKREFEW